MYLGYSDNIAPLLVEEWLKRFNLFIGNVANVDTGATLASHSSVLFCTSDVSPFTFDITVIVMPLYSSLYCATNAINYSIPEVEVVGRGQFPDTVIRIY